MINDLIQKYDIFPSGIIHVGAHEGQELEDYHDFDRILLIEPIPQYAKALREKGYKVIEAAICETSGKAEFYITTFDQGSSLLKPIEHTVSEKIIVDTVRLEDLGIDDYNVLVVDTQGNEISVLKSAGNKIRNFEMIIAEGSDRPRYENSLQTADLIIFMNSIGFQFVEYREHSQQIIKDCIFVKCH